MFVLDVYSNILLEQVDWRSSDCVVPRLSFLLVDMHNPPCSRVTQWRIASNHHDRGEVETGSTSLLISRLDFKNSNLAVTAASNEVEALAQEGGVLLVVEALLLEVEVVPLVDKETVRSPLSLVPKLDTAAEASVLGVAQEVKDHPGVVPQALEALAVEGSSRGGGGSRGGFGTGPAQVFAANTPARPDARLSTVDQLVTSFKTLNVGAEMPLRPGWGTLGRPIMLRANFFAVKIPTKGVYYNYDVTISPAKDAKGERKGRIFDLLEQSPQCAPYAGHVAHDRSQRLVSAKKLPQPLSIVVPFYEEGETGPRPGGLTFTVDIKLTNDPEIDIEKIHEHTNGRPNRRDYDALPLISALNLVLQRHATKNGIRVGKNRYFFPSSEHMQLGLGIEAWKGFFMSVRPAYKQLMVNVNVCMTAFYIPGNLADAMLEFQRRVGGMPQTFGDKLKVSTTHLGYLRKRSIFRIMNTTASKTMFDCEELGGQVSVEQYFQRKYRIRLRHANDLPVINVGNARKPNFLPAEICEIVPGQAYRGKLDGDETAAMIRFACNPPAINAESIVNEGFTELGLRPDAAAATLTTLGAFGVSVDQEMTVVPGRILPAPIVTYKSGRPNVRDGSWNILDVKLQSGGNMTNWAVLLVEEGRRMEFSGTSDPELIGFLQTFSQKCRSSGMVVPNVPPKIMNVRLPSPQGDPNRTRAIEQIRQTFRNNLNPKQKPSFVLVLLSGVDKFIYPGIKRLCDVDMGLHTVHMLLNKARGDPKKQDQYFSNVALKVNSKLGGMNHILDPSSMKWLTEKKTMVMGIDVTHPSPNSIPGTPSIVAVVASVDDHFVQFPAGLSLQKPDWNRESKEMVESLTPMTIERLQLYEKKNRRLPDRVVVFRDGVSEGQYKLVLREELPKIQEAFKRVSPKVPYHPKLTIMICGKRHHARFYPTDPKDMSRNGNTLPGTVLDKGVTDVYNFDFYLQASSHYLCDLRAHAGLQGQVRPTHYTIIYDENKMSADTLQQGTHTASYLYARATKAVSLVPAAYYADLACERGRYYLNTLLNTADDRSSIGRGASTAEREAAKERVYEEAVKMGETAFTRSEGIYVLHLMD
ncbi:Protein argonaute 1B [Grifola frondosa]|uniref:Protein argonaute 1B n=1 Tax=Grifola frondosa TaxID=5627 RepID=A0A1C7M8P2_GRIFR|nr:Protein argonaute 1B [Grifola frondosa]